MCLGNATATRGESASEEDVQRGLGDGIYEVIDIRSEQAVHYHYHEKQCGGQYCLPIPADPGRSSWISAPE
jgi:hypothetical protein